MTLLVPVVLGYVVQVVAAHHHCPLHLGRNDNALEDPPADGDFAGEGALLVDVGALYGLLWGLEVESHVLVVPHSCARLLCQQFLAVQEH